MATKGSIHILPLVNGGHELRFNRPDGELEFKFVSSDVHPTLRDAVFNYGLKQILADAGAVSNDASAMERLAKIEKRAVALRSGDWSFRDGISAPKPATEFAAMYRALVAAAAFADTPATATVWAGMKPTEKRAVFAACPDAAAHLPAAPVDGASLLARLTIAA